jgi:transcriptional regulator GlxA family with amidase domain
MTNRRIGVLLFDGVEELDAVGPWEVLAHWSLEVAQGWEVVAVGAGAGLVRGAKGLGLQVDAVLGELPLDVLVHPGGAGTRPLLRDLAHLELLRRLRTGGVLMTSVCTGALPYAAAGLLAGRPATTHWAAFGELTALDPTLVPRPDERVVDDGDVITSAGVSAGIDMALHLVERLDGPDAREAVRREIQYEV